MLWKIVQINLICVLIALVGLTGCASDQRNYRQAAQTKQSEPNEQYELAVDASGWYRICPEDIPENPSINLADYQLLQGEHGIRTWMTKSNFGDCMEFLVDLPNHRFAGQMRLKLIPGKVSGARFDIQKLSSYQPENFYKPQAVVKWEQNQIYEPLFEGLVPWFWQRLHLGESASLELDLTSFNAMPIGIRVNLWSKTADAITESKQSPGHHLMVQINEEPSLLEKWIGKGSHSVEFSLSSALLFNRSLQLKLTLPSNPGDQWDEIYIDDIELFYNPETAVIDDQLTNLEDGWVSTEGWGDVFIAEYLDGFAQKIWRTDSKDHFFRTDKRLIYRRYRADTPRQPVYISKTANWQAELSALADVRYVVIGPNEFKPAAQPLIELRRNQGLRSAYVAQEMIFNQFGDGTAHPEAVRIFLGSIKKSLAPELQYVVLIGDPSHEIGGRAGRSNMLPSAFIYTLYGGWTASDALLGDLDGDGLPELAMGRLPVKNIRELRVVIEKILLFENRTQQGNPKKIRIGIGVDPAEPVFAESAEQITAELEKMSGYLGVSIISAKEELDAWLNAPKEIGGQLFYFGHGSIQQLSEINMLSVETLGNQSSNPKNAVMYMFTCLAGYFVHPQIESLAEVLLQDPNSGFIAVYAPTSLTLSTDQIPLAEYIAKRIISGKPERYGDLFDFEQLSREGLTPGLLDVVATMVFLGDPAMQFP